jgi:hypothetical protein
MCERDWRPYAPTGSTGSSTCHQVVPVGPRSWSGVARRAGSAPAAAGQGVLASHGIPALGIAYFDAPGLPCALSRIPLEYSKISGGRRLPLDAARRINAGVRPWGISNERFHRATHALEAGEKIPRAHSCRPLLQGAGVPARTPAADRSRIGRLPERSRVPGWHLSVAPTLGSIDPNQRITLPPRTRSLCQP